MSSKNSPDAISPINSTQKLTWRLSKKFYSPDGIKVTIRKAKEDSNAVLYCLKTPDGKRFLLQRTSHKMILVSSDNNDSTRFIACELK